MSPIHKAAHVRSIEHNLSRVYEDLSGQPALPKRLQDAMDRLQARSAANLPSDMPVTAETRKAED